MNIGMTYEMDQEKLKADIESGTQVFLGVPVHSLLNEINLLEIKHGYDFQEVVADLKAECMQHLGLMKVDQPQEPDEPEEPEVEAAPEEPIKEDLLKNGDAR